MASLFRRLKLGSLELGSNIMYSPLAGCSDLPFRKMSAKYSPGLIFCEMVKMDALIRNDLNTFHILDYETDMHPIGGQICGSKLAYAAASARIIEDLGFDVVDLNCGCPVDKVTKDGSGSGLLKNPQKIADLVAEMVAVVKIPVTVKVRAGWDENSITAHEITRLVEAAGASAIFVHGRTREQAYKGPANWDFIKACKEASRGMPVIGNGDVFSGEAAQEMMLRTGCDGVLVARGTMGQPWIAESIKRHLLGEEELQWGKADTVRVLKEHFNWITKYYPEKKAVLDFRRVGCWYIKGAANTKDIRGKMSKVTTIQEAWELIKAWENEKDLSCEAAFDSEARDAS